ncbi:hypothetical protein THAOC_00113 [Thalassiosira oceanica]|uniref:Uncharacterized protein n=1 Tax=Thalassiosira oceanica TaxID=159749 RepID=K0TGX1_THAOC|nr:hypothetical protein THAOC_00113 [Thalassiosira oceanica]|eukprot:EJK78013.1 hypothetical protein THAOC_00113 [Thalassiosira oceanica]
MKATSSCLWYIEEGSSSQNRWPSSKLPGARPPPPMTSSDPTLAAATQRIFAGVCKAEQLPGSPHERSDLGDDIRVDVGQIDPGRNDDFKVDRQHLVVSPAT